MNLINPEASRSINLPLLTLFNVLIQAVFPSRLCETLKYIVMFAFLK